MTRTPRNLTYFDFPLPPGGLSDAAGKAWMDGYTRYVETGVDAVQVVFADNHMDLAAMNPPDIDTGAAVHGYQIVGRTSALGDRVHHYAPPPIATHAMNSPGAAPDPDRAASDYLAATVPVHPKLPEREPRTPRPARADEVLWAWPEIPTFPREYITAGQQPRPSSRWLGEWLAKVLGDSAGQGDE
jgi:hypothetical protein